MEDQFHAIIAWQNSRLYLRLNHVLVQLHCGHKENLSGFLIQAHARAAIACGKFNGLPPIVPPCALSFVGCVLTRCHFFLEVDRTP